MEKMLCCVLLACCFTAAVFTDPPPPPCVIELECSECVPDNMPLVTSHGVVAGAVRVPSGERLTLDCAAGSFLAYPLRHSLDVVCEAGQYRVLHDNQLTHLLDLGCQENIFEDILHQVEHCNPPLQGRAYQMQSPGRGARHLATVCFSADRASPLRARASSSPTLHLPPHHDARAPLTILGNFNHMFDAKTRHDADKMYSDEARMNRRLHEIFKHRRFSFADQYLTSAKLLSDLYFDDQNRHVTDFVSNKVPAWRSVAFGNLQHLQRDVASLMRRARLDKLVLDLYTGTHDVLKLRSGAKRKDFYLKPGMFPVPKYLWAVIHDKQNDRAVAVTVLNDPFVTVNEIKESLFCESSCKDVRWLGELARDYNYMRPLYGLVFCCNVHNFTDIVPEMPKQIIKDVPAGNTGMLIDLPNTHEHIRQ